MRSHVYANFSRSSSLFFFFSSSRSCYLLAKFRRASCAVTFYLHPVYITTTRTRTRMTSLVARHPGMYERNHLRATRGSGETRSATLAGIRVWTENHLGTLVLPCLPECTALDQLGGSRGRIVEGETRGDAKREGERKLEYCSDAA